MKINVHTHVFNFQSILTAETLVVLKYRLTGIGLPGPIRRVLLSYLKRRLHKNVPISEHDFVEYAAGHGLFDATHKDADELSQSVIMGNPQHTQNVSDGPFVDTLSQSVIIDTPESTQYSTNDTLTDTLSHFVIIDTPETNQVASDGASNEELSQSVIINSNHTHQSFIPEDILHELSDTVMHCLNQPEEACTKFPSDQQLSQFVNSNGLPKSDPSGQKSTLRKRNRISKLLSGPLKRRILRRGARAMGLHRYRPVLDLGIRLAMAAYPSKSTLIRNYYEWVKLGLSASIDEITDQLMAQLDPEDVVVLLPMDIIDRDNHPTEKPLYLKQLHDTQRQALRYPGRILPFAMVNTLREDAVEVFKQAVQSGACFGLKLYPSLGYRVDSAEMMEVFGLCESYDLPVLLHCNDRGFARDSRHAELASPAPWDRILAQFPTLKVCFGHFGGEVQTLSGSQLDLKSDRTVFVWELDEFPVESFTYQILQLMRKYPGRVFADTSYHIKFNRNPVARDRYFSRLRSLLDDDRYGGQILWGSDFHLIRQAITEREYVRLYESGVGEYHFRRMSLDNPVRYLYSR